MSSRSASFVCSSLHCVSSKEIPSLIVLLLHWCDNMLASLKSSPLQTRLARNLLHRNKNDQKSVSYSPKVLEKKQKHTNIIWYLLLFLDLRAFVDICGRFVDICGHFAFDFCSSFQHGTIANHFRAEKCTFISKTCQVCVHTIHFGSKLRALQRIAYSLSCFVSMFFTWMLKKCLNIDTRVP